MNAPLALYRRYRPDNYADVIGQEHVTEPLQRALRNNRVNHAYLFSGPRGCGKTTSARILARCLNCEQGPTPTPCGECRSCTDLARGGPGSIDVIEIDAASHGGVDDARDLRERAFFAPVSSHYKIYIVDEAHMVTTQGFNALLKLVEEPPEHLKFIFATTEPDKVIGTIRSRTHHYPFRLVPPRVLSDYLAYLCKQEGVSIDPAVLPLVVRAGGGSVRDTLSVLDQLMGGAGDDGVTYAHAVGLLGYTHDSLLDEIVDALAAHDGAAVFASVDKVIESGQDPKRFAEDLLHRLRDLVILSAVPDAATSGLLEGPADQAERLAGQAARFGTAALTRAASEINDALIEMRGATAPRLHLELLCARVLLPAADDSALGLGARLDRLERRLSIGGGAPDPGGAAPAPVPAPAAQAPSVSAPAAEAPAARASQAPPQAPAERPAQQRPAAQQPSAPAADSGGGGGWDSQPAASAPAAAGSGVAAWDDAPSAPAQQQPPAQQPSAPAADSGGGGWDNQPAPAAQPQPAQQTPAGGPPSGEAGSLSIADVRRVWPEILEDVKGRRRFTWSLLSSNAQVNGLHGDTLTIALVNAGARDSFARSGSEDILREALRSVLGVNWRIDAIVDPSAGAGRTGGSPAPAPAQSQAPAQPQGPPAQPAANPPGWDDQPAAPAPQPSPSEPPTAPPGAPQAAGRPQAQPQSAQRPPAEAARPAAAPPPDEPPPPPDPEEYIDRDTDLPISEAPSTHTELLTRELGAEIID
ncbi:DNA polymerase III subunit gamma and tau [Flindersiella endophytica]